jgi:hypothetical protein
MHYIITLTSADCDTHICNVIENISISSYIRNNMYWNTMKKVEKK